MLIHISRCWIDGVLRRWGSPPLLEAHAAECDGYAFFPPELAEAQIGAPRRKRRNLDEEGDCASRGCVDGGCVLGQYCLCEAGVYGKLCTVRWRLPVSADGQIAEISVAPDGIDNDACGGQAASACRTIAHALLRQFWEQTWAAQHSGGTHGSESAVVRVVLANGVYAGEGNSKLTLHGAPVHITSLVGSRASMVDCGGSQGGSDWDYLIGAGEGVEVTVSHLSLRRCFTKSQAAGAVSAHPQYAAYSAHPMQAASYLANRWLV